MNLLNFDVLLDHFGSVLCLMQHRIFVKEWKGF